MKPKLEKNVMLSIKTRTGKEPVLATLSNGVLFAHASGLKRYYNVSCVDEGDSLRTSMTRAQAERIVRGTAKSSLRKLPAFLAALREGGLGAGKIFKAFVRYAQRVEREPGRKQRPAPAPCKHARCVLVETSVFDHVHQHAIICCACASFRWYPINLERLSDWPDAPAKPRREPPEFAEGAKFRILARGDSPTLEPQLAQVVFAKRRPGVQREAA